MLVFPVSKAGIEKKDGGRDHRKKILKICQGQSEEAERKIMGAE